MLGITEFWCSRPIGGGRKAPVEEVREHNDSVLRAMRDASPNVYIDTSGSNLDDGQIEFAAAELGAERVLFGTDGIMSGSVGKVLDAALTEAEKDLIFRGNVQRILAAQGETPLASKREGVAP